MNTVIIADSTSAIGPAYKIPLSPQAIGRNRIIGIKQIPCLKVPRKKPSLPFPKARNKEEFEKRMLEISCKPINIFLDFNAVIVNLENMPKESQKECLNHTESNMNALKTYLEENIAMKEHAPDVPATGMAVLCQ